MKQRWHSHIQSKFKSRKHSFLKRTKKKKEMEINKPDLLEKEEIGGEMKK